MLLLLLLLLVASMTLKQSQCNLHEYLPYEIFNQSLALLLAFGDQLGQITSLAVLHDDIQIGLFLIDDLIIASDNVLMLELSQNVHFIDKLMNFLFA